jgi:hypothetical protein
MNFFEDFVVGTRVEIGSHTFTVDDSRENSIPSRFISTKRWRRALISAD